MHFDAEITQFRSSTEKLYSNNKAERQTYQPKNFNDPDGDD
jgi:hypothetical protein